MARLSRLWKRWVGGHFLDLLRLGGILLTVYLIYLDVQFEGWELRLAVIALHVFIAISFALLRQRLAGGKMEKE